MSTQSNVLEFAGTVKAGTPPAWAVAVIVAERVEDQSDMMTDYFATHTKRTVALAWSKHKRDLFAELRKAASTFKATEHLGVGCDVYSPRVVLAQDIIDHGCAYYAGQQSPWHGELDGHHGNRETFATRAEAEAHIAGKGEPHPIMFGETLVAFRWDIGHASIEHREKYSMGAGYYLKASGRYSDGWIVRKTWLGADATNLEASPNMVRA